MVVPPSYLRWFSAANIALLGFALPRSDSNLFIIKVVKPFSPAGKDNPG